MKCNCNKCIHQCMSFHAYNDDGDCERVFGCDLEDVYEGTKHTKAMITEECEDYEEKDGVK